VPTGVGDGQILEFDAAAATTAWHVGEVASTHSRAS
jgi:hypothetical protein